MHYLYDDQTLLKKIGEGDKNSFNTLFKRHWKSVYNQAYKRLQDHDKAEDVTQEVFCKLWEKRSDLSIDNLPAYLYIVVRNRVLNLFEKEKRLASVDHLLDGSVAPARADFQVLQNEFLAAYKALINTLPNKRKTIFLQYYEMGKSTDEIAELLGVSRKTVQNQLGRAVTFLRTELTNLLVILIVLILG